MKESCQGTDVAKSCLIDVVSSRRRSKGAVRHSAHSRVSQEETTHTLVFLILVCQYEKADKFKCIMHSITFCKTSTDLSLLSDDAATASRTLHKKPDLLIFIINNAPRMKLNLTANLSWC